MPGSELFMAVNDRRTNVDAAAGRAAVITLDPIMVCADGAARAPGPDVIIFQIHTTHLGFGL
jgi:hypothetical protein